MTVREELIKKIENNDPEILGQLADILLAQMCAPKLKEVKCTTKELNNMIRKQVKK